MNMKRVMYVLSHALTTYILGCLWLLFTDATGLEAAAVGAMFLVAKEFGEFVGKEKAAGTFENDFEGNFEEFKEALGSGWQLLQTFGAAAIALPALYLTDYLL